MHPGTGHCRCSTATAGASLDIGSEAGTSVLRRVEAREIFRAIEEEGDEFLRRAGCPQHADQREAGRTPSPTLRGAIMTAAARRRRLFCRNGSGRIWQIGLMSMV